MVCSSGPELYMSDADQKDAKAQDFSQLAQAEDPGFFAEFWDFLKNNKKWWLTPIIVVLIMFGLLIAMAGNAAVAPFIYNMF